MKGIASETRRFAFQAVACVVLSASVGIAAGAARPGVHSARAPEPVRLASVPVPAVTVQPSNPPITTPLPTAERVFKLQGLYWRPNRPSAVVNGKTVFVGDPVETARVTAIDQKSVTLSVNGQSKTLSIP